ncbi:hypothetical protein B1748_12145 [Paenibacillus sp. MY03]|nr:hypothetical protein B1748_12145 [Paenibacillus sp. MY03]
MYEMTKISIENEWLSRGFEVNKEGLFRTVSLQNKTTGFEYVKPARDTEEEFSFICYYGEAMMVLKTRDFSYESHRFISSEESETLTVRLALRSGGDAGYHPFAIGGWGSAGSLLAVELIYQAYHQHPVIRKRMTISSKADYPVRIQYLGWEQLALSPGEGRQVHHSFFTQTSAAVSNCMDDSVMAIEWPDANEGLLVATEAPGSMKHMELFANGDHLHIGYNDKEETIFEWQLEPGETFESDCSFFLSFCHEKWQDVVDRQLGSFVKNSLSVCRPEQVPTFTVNTWETFYSDINEEIVLENIKIAAEMGIEAYQLDCGWYFLHGDFEPDPVKFPRGLDPIVEACRASNIKLGLWMSVSNMHIDSSIAKEHPEWFLTDENEQHGFMVGWKDTAIMCLDSDFKGWILDEIDRTVKKYDVKLLKLDLAAVRDPYNPHKSIGCHSRDHHHGTQKSSNLRIYRSMFWIMDELRNRNPDCLLDLTFELYGVLHNMDLALIQHAHQNWIVNSDTAWLDNLRRMIHTRSRVVPSYTLNFGSCHLTDPLSRHVGFWSALAAHGLYYGDLRKLSGADREHYGKWIKWVKDYRTEFDFLAYHQVSDTFPASDAPDHVDRRFHPYSFYEAARVKSTAKEWDGFAKLKEDGEGLIVVFRPEHSEQPNRSYALPWMKAEERYAVYDVLRGSLVGYFNGKALQEGLELHIAEQPGVLVLQIQRLLAEAVEIDQK